MSEQSVGLNYCNTVTDYPHRTHQYLDHINAFLICGISRGKSV